MFSIALAFVGISLLCKSPGGQTLSPVSYTHLNFYRAFSLLLYKTKMNMIENILANLTIERLNPMQEAYIRCV